MSRDLKFRWLDAVLLLSDDVLSTTEKVTAVVHFRFADADGGNVRPSVPAVVHWSGFGKSTVQRHRAKLKRLGLLTEVRRGGRDAGGRNVATTYRLTIPEGSLLGETTNCDDVQQGSPSSETPDRSEGSHFSPEGSRSGEALPATTTNPLTTTSKDELVVPSFWDDEDEPLDAWDLVEREAAGLNRHRV